MPLVAASTVSELMRATPAVDVVAWVHQQPAAQMCTTSVTLAEVRYSIARLPAGRRRDLLRATADDVFRAFADQVLAFDDAAATHYADIVVEREHCGSPISGSDAQIAAVCRTHHASLATRNTDDFDRLGLDLIDPWTNSP